MRSSISLLLAALILLTAPGVFGAEELLKPTKAQSALRKALKKVPRSGRAEESRKRSIEYLAEWKASGRKPTPADNYALAQFNQSAGEFVKSAELFRFVQTDKGAKEKTRDYAGSAEAQLLLNPAVRDGLGEKGLSEAAARLRAYAAAMAAFPARAKGHKTILKVLARVYDMGGETQAAYDLRLQILKLEPKAVTTLAHPMMQGLLGSTHAMADYDALRIKADATMKLLLATQGSTLGEAKAKLDKAVAKLRSLDAAAFDENGRLKKTKDEMSSMSPEERDVFKAQWGYDKENDKVKALTVHRAPFALLGKPAPDWTLEREFGDVVAMADLKGKVILMDFWMTRHAVNNFTVMRDLARDYGEKGLKILGVTASTAVCYDSRYDTDKDMAHKGTPGARLAYAARLASDKSPPNEQQAIYAEEEYRQIEIQAIIAFIENHELKWPVILIDQDEPEAKYALVGWPHLVLIDKQGRIRFFKGALSRDKKLAVAGLRAAIETLLAE